MKRSFQISLSLNALIVQAKLMKSRHIKGNGFVDIKCFKFHRSLRAMNVLS